MSILLSEHIELLATAPNGVQKLRELILELAVMGKLVPQDSSDEPARTMLERIAQKRVQMENDAPRRKNKQKPLAGNESWPFAIPKGWEWARLSDLTQILNGRAYSKDELLDKGTPVLRVGNLFTSNHWYYSNLTLGPEKYCDEGDLIYSWSASFGPFIWTGPKVIYHYHIWKLSLFDETSYSKAFLYKFLLAKTAEIKAAGHGVSMAHMTKEKMEKLPVPVPPFAEQHRIVAKVNELMALCDRLEAEQADAEAAQAKLVESLLGTLTQSDDAADFAANWQRLAGHFDTLFTTEFSINVLKQTILQLAVMGKLVRQNPNDEPASKLIKQITHERTRLEAQGICRKVKPVPRVTEVEQPFNVPKNWEWERIGNYVLQTDYGLSEKTFVSNEGTPVLKMGDIQEGRVVLGGQKAVPTTTEGLPYLLLEPDDLLYNRTNSAELVGKTGIFRGEAKQFSFASYLIRIRCAKDFAPASFLNFAMNAPIFRETEIVPHVKQQCGQANVNGTILRNMRIPIPPAAEQKRIVAKVHELLAFCDNIKADIVESRNRKERLASLLIDSALRAA